MFKIKPFFSRFTTDTATRGAALWRHSNTPK